MQFYIKEVPTGFTNGVNKDFVLLHYIAELDDIFVDGAIYTGSIVTNGFTLTLGDAPTASIFVDYWGTATPRPAPLTNIILVSDVKQSLLNLLQDISDVEDTIFLEWVNFALRFIYDKVKRVDPSRFIGTATYNVTAPPQQFDIPNDFQDMNQTPCGMFIDGTDTKLGITSYGKKREGFYFSGNKVIFTNSSPVVDQTYTMHYIPLPPVITLLTDYLTIDAAEGSEPIVETRHMEYFVKAIRVLYEQWDNNPTAESVADFRFVRALGLLLEGYNRLPQISVMKNPTNNF